MTCCLGEPWSLILPHFILTLRWICFIIKFLKSALSHSSRNIQHIHSIPWGHERNIRIHLHHLRNMLSRLNLPQCHQARPMLTNRVTYHFSCCRFSLSSNHSRLLYFFIPQHHEFLSIALVCPTSLPFVERSVYPLLLWRTHGNIWNQWSHNL